MIWRDNERGSFIYSAFYAWYGALQNVRGRAAKIDALETAYTDGPGDREEQAKYDLAVDFVNVLRKAPGVAYTR